MITLIVKVDTTMVIGDSKRNCMPWEGVDLNQGTKNANIQDMKRFVQLRKGKNPKTAPDIVIMGRKTRDSISSKYRPFVDNINYIISRNPDLELGDTKGEQVQVWSSIETCLSHISEHYYDRTVHIIGGGQIYQYALDHHIVDQIDMTILHHEFDGDIYFPHLGDIRHEINRQDFGYHSFVTYHKSILL